VSSWAGDAVCLEGGGDRGDDALGQLLDLGAAQRERADVGPRRVARVGAR
jgi:hypothetical protein